MVHDRCRLRSTSLPNWVSSATASSPLWALTALTLNIIVLYALTARWEESDMSFPYAGLKPRDCREGRPRMLGRPSRSPRAIVLLITNGP